ncbi:hypothetical protein [Pseudomonas sp. KBW05]|uniref:hypothetical protein n=1 Tax=Pseudomonas sp. KBW05 TaxID=2153360 RepID=UPI000F5925A5|nr:hypothetical protein [Pseudomonas sp. KBW05]
MDVARCIADGNTYTAHNFEQLGDSRIEGFRRLLVCVQCGAPAFFRKESRSGQAACFGARPHIPGCEFAAAEGRRRGNPGNDQEEQINLGERIEIDFGYGAQEIVHPTPDNPIDPNGRGGRFVPGSGRRSPVMHRRLSTLLRNLMVSEQFRNSDQIIGLPEGQFRVRDFFVRFNEANRDHVGEYRGYWGMLSDARYGQENSLWLNSGGRENLSVVADTAIVDGLHERFDVDDLEEFAGSYILVFGTLRVSGNGKGYVACNDLRHITVSLSD